MNTVDGGCTLEEDTAQLARTIVELASNRKAEDVLMLDMRPASYVADYFVLCSGGSERHLKALADEIKDELANQDVRPLRVEGKSESGWILMDYGSVVLHIFGKEERAYYALDHLWQEAAPVLRMQ